MESVVARTANGLGGTLNKVSRFREEALNVLSLLRGTHRLRTATINIGHLIAYHREGDALRTGLTHFV